MSERFTIDGSDELEKRLAHTCHQVGDEVAKIIPAAKLEAVVLGGGYGRGEGGVLETGMGEEPYNDLEFYVFTRGNRLANERAFRGPLDALGERLSPGAGLHVEFKVDSVNRLRRAPVSMFSYDLVSGHKIIVGNQDVFSGCEHHKDAGRIPLHEATRLLFNRCTGLLFAKNFLRLGWDAGRADFVGRNLAKAQLALGDVVLTTLGKYHWSVRERERRLKELEGIELPVPVAELQHHHTAGTEFKLHPQRSAKDPATLLREHEEIAGCARRIWMWLENRRLRRPFATTWDYSVGAESKCPETSSLKNLFINSRFFGLTVLSGRYPRERLLRTLPILLWKNDALGERRYLMHVQSQLRTDATALPGLVIAYEQIWRRFN